MTDIVLSKKDEVYLKVKCEPSIGQELNDHFSFDVPGAKFHPLYRSRMWDGKVRLYSMFTQELYVGLKSYLEHFCKERDYTIDYSQYVEQADSVTYDIVKEFCLSLKLASKGEPIEVRDYQIDAVYQAISDGRRLLLSPTGSGKSLILYCLLRWKKTVQVDFRLLPKLQEKKKFWHTRMQL
jgi:hypothetical protein